MIFSEGIYDGNGCLLLPLFLLFRNLHFVICICDENVGYIPPIEIPKNMKSTCLFIIFSSKILTLIQSLACLKCDLANTMTSLTNFTPF